MGRSRTSRGVAALSAGLLLASVACSDDGGEADDVPVASTASPATTAPPDFQSVEDGSSSTEPRPVVPLGDVCPDEIVVQASGLPTVRLGPLYALLASGAEVSEDGTSVSGSLRRPGSSAEDITLEIRTGGPSVGFRPALDIAQSDPSVHLVTTALADLASRTDSDSIGVAALATLNDRMIMWSADAYPDIGDLDQLGGSGVEIRHITAEPFIAYLTVNGVLDADQLVPGGGDAVANFVTAGGDIARQGDTLMDPPLFEAIPEWNGPITIGPASSRGWLDVEPVLATVGPGRLDDACLDQLVPGLQRAIPAYASDPAPTNELMATLRRRVDPFDRVDASVLDAAQATAAGEQVPDGGFDTERIEAFLPTLAASLGTEVRSADDAVTERHLDPTL